MARQRGILGLLVIAWLLQSGGCAANQFADTLLLGNATTAVRIINVQEDAFVWVRLISTVLGAYLCTCTYAVLIQVG